MISAGPHHDAEAQGTVEPATFRDAMARFPTGVTIVTTHDEDGVPYGFTASSFCSVSLDPPLVLVCLAKSANSYPVFARTGHFAVSILQAHHADVAHRFASKAADKFASGEFVRTDQDRTVLAGAAAAVECLVASRYDVGDHMIMVGRVDTVLLGDKGTPAIYFDRRFGTVATVSRE
ncbi:actinorhodin polyketide dimerase [Actinoplanes cyaneus]|uniref:Actinorhodin polyketide dimerase n=1 Tax=Actinoplanes cyaneus TaxID=52696 RepID=A0A919M9W8_9ACTN|nr:flavin reductase family protein [Actinoplanes cyaneus]MCW2139738.1 flavin reductase ActVB [Actinoplanes cyaneus]GID69893.1 actinorhodin polyketide dimerase [Actinoplanes cyaneus]